MRYDFSLFLATSKKSARGVVPALALVWSVGCDVILGLDDERTLRNETVAGSGGGSTGSSCNGGAPGTYAETIKCDGPIAYFRFEEANGTFVDDVNPSQPAVASADVVSVPEGAVERAASFAKGTANAEVGDHFAFAGKVPMSIELWAKSTSGAGGAGPGFQSLISKRVPEPQQGYSISIDGQDGRLQFTRASATSQFRHAQALVNLETFRHVVGTFDGTTSILYVDGEVMDVNDKAGELALPATSESFRIGGGETSSNFEGVLDELALYDKALTPTQVKAHFEAQRP